MELAAAREKWLLWMAAMVGSYAALPGDEKRQLHEWERRIIGSLGQVSTSNWPGWERYIGPCPAPPLRQIARRARKPLSVQMRAVVFARDGLRCRACGADDENDLQVDHIVPVSAGGTNHYDNLQTLCKTCNMRKGAQV